MLRTGKSRLVNANAANQIKTATANESDFDERVMTELILNASIVLLNVGRAQIAIENLACQRNPFYECRKLIG